MPYKNTSKGIKRKNGSAAQVGSERKGMGNGNVGASVIVK